MDGALAFLRKLFFRRKHQRFLVRSGTYVVIVTPNTMGHENERQVHLIDISMGGAAFIYEGNPNMIDETGYIKALPGPEGDLSEKVHFETVSDIPSRVCDGKLETLRRRGVRFTWLGARGEKFLKDLIKEKGVCAL
jgi:hypothetical protein